MSEIEFVRTLKNVLQHQNMMGERINRLALSKRARRARY
jgi:hypothetical protein